MARGRVDRREYGVAVVGLSGTGQTGVGKSCLCNRFMRPHQDDYYTNHISLLSQTDFGGRVVNNDHFLYWGEATRAAEEGVQYGFQVIEQTEFIDDSSFQPFKSGKTEQYHKRCAATKIQSAEKLMYICKDQLGLELEHEQRYLSDGRLSIDGFLCLYDVSAASPRQQADYVILILQQLVKTKKPVVIVTTKHDDLHEPNLKELDKILSRKDIKSGNIPIVESSAQLNINIDHAFLILAQLMDKSIKKPPKVIAYSEAARTLNERKDSALESYRTLVRTNVTDYKCQWTAISRKLKNHPDTQYFVALFGTSAAQKEFRRHTKFLRDEIVRARQVMYMDKLQALLKRILPDLSSTQDRSWPSCQRWLQTQDYFHEIFLSRQDGLPWQQTDIIESPDTRIPFDLLESADAENVYRNHVNVLRAEYRRNELRAAFKKCLEENENICPGKSLADVTIFFLGRECFTQLSEDDKSAIYEQHQQTLHAKARLDFQELLQEQAEFFTRLEQREIRREDLYDLTETLKPQSRYQALRLMQKERESILYNHLAFVQQPARERCMFGDQCVDNQLETILFSKARRPQSWSQSAEVLLEAEDNRLNLVLLGATSLIHALAHQIRSQCIEDEYTLDGEIYSLDYRLIDGDVTLPQHSLSTKDFQPHGCFCVFHDAASLAGVEASVEQAVLARDDSELHGLPLVLVLAHDPQLSDSGLQNLRNEAQALADRLQCPFTDIPSALMDASAGHYHADQVSLAMHSLLRCVKQRAALKDRSTMIESLEPDIRLLMCFMCGDAFDLELPLAPLLNHQCCHVNHLDRFPTVTVETYLDDSKRRVEVTVAAYHDTSLLRDELFHGYILVYSALRTASLANLKAFSQHVMAETPAKMVAVSEGGASALFSCHQSHSLLLDGNAWADDLNAQLGHWSFMTTCDTFRTQTASYTPFFRECWEQKASTEAAHSFSDQRDHLQARTPMTTFGKTSQSNSADPWEPIHDRPQLERCWSDGEGDGRHGGPGRRRGSDVSPFPSAPGSGGRGGVSDTSPYASVPIVQDDMGYYLRRGGGAGGYQRNHGHYRSLRATNTERHRNSYPSATRTPPSYVNAATLSHNAFPPEVDNFATSFMAQSMTQSVLDEPVSGHQFACDGQPRYQFRKSNSMKLALQEMDEVSPWMDEFLAACARKQPSPPAASPPSPSPQRKPAHPKPRRKKLVKQMTLPAISCVHQTHQKSSALAYYDYDVTNRVSPPLRHQHSDVTNRMSPAPHHRLCDVTDIIPPLPSRHHCDVIKLPDTGCDVTRDLSTDTMPVDCDVTDSISDRCADNESSVFSSSFEYQSPTTEARKAADTKAFGVTLPGHRIIADTVQILHDHPEPVSKPQPAKVGPMYFGGLFTFAEAESGAHTGSLARGLSMARGLAIGAARAHTYSTLGAAYRRKPAPSNRRPRDDCDVSRPRFFTGLTDGSNTQAGGRKTSPQLSLTSGVLHAGNEEIQIAGEYAQVRDALVPLENEYAEVCDALPDGRVHRMRNKPATNKGGPDSTTDSEFSSLERDALQSMYARVSRKPTPHKKKAKTRNPGSSLPPPPPPPHVSSGRLGDKSWLTPLHGSLDKLRSNSPSEGSEGGPDDSAQIGNGGGSRKPTKKRRSFKKKRDRDDAPLIAHAQPGESDPDSANASLNKAFIDDDASDLTSPRSETENGEDALEGGRWKNLFSNLIITDKSADAQRRKDEKRKLKEEEKKQKEQQKAQKKAQHSKKKDSKSSLPGVSGLVLEDLVTPELPVPAFVRVCVEYIEREGLAAEGIYRVPGNRAQVELLFDKFREDENVDMVAHDIPVNAAATALKQFFMDLSCPLIPTQLYDELIEVAGVKYEQYYKGISELSTRLCAVRGVLNKIPPPNLTVLKYLITHIHKVSESSSENKMSIDNLAVCWWPTILRPNFDSFESMNLVSKYLEEVIKIIIRQYRFFFYGEDQV